MSGTREITIKNGGNLFFDIKFNFDSGVFKVISTVTPDLNNPNKNYQINEEFYLNVEFDIKQVVGNHMDILIKKVKQQPTV